MQLGDGSAVRLTVARYYTPTGRSIQKPYENKENGEYFNDFQERLQPLLDRHGVDMMVSGHIHNFQHIRTPGSEVDYFVNSSASQSREVVPFEGALFTNPDTGFTLCTAKEAELILTFVDKNGKIIYQHSREK